VIVCFVDIGEL